MVQKNLKENFLNANVMKRNEWRTEPGCNPTLIECFFVAPVSHRTRFSKFAAVGDASLHDLSDRRATQLQQAHLFSRAHLKCLFAQTTLASFV